MTLFSSVFLTGVDTSHISVLECDITDEDVLKQTCSRAKVLMNCTKYSEPVVKACIEARTHYIDISIELPVRIYTTEK